MLRVLFASSEAYPLVKTGGLADVSGSLPRALQNLGHDLRLLLPAYREAVEKSRAVGIKQIATFTIDGNTVSILESRLPGSRVKTWLVDCPLFFDRPGNPYLDSSNRDYPDNAARFLLLARVAAELALNRCGLDWQPDVLHCNDWQTALAPALLAQEDKRPATVFTIHNLAYQGLFDYASFVAANLPAQLWHYSALEFHGQFSFIKGGLVYADRINTVSPTYAREIQIERFGYGLQGLLQHRSDKLSGILNGIDADEWNPGTDAHLAQRYNRRSLTLKVNNKLALQQQLGLKCSATTPLFGFVGRLVEQKGIDWIIANIETLLDRGAQLVILGSGEPTFEAALRAASARMPDAIAVTIGYSEALAHQIEASADLFLMPSKFEPCGLNQLYSLRYGTVPIVHRVGGLADTVVDANAANLALNSATGFVFDTDSTMSGDDALRATLQRALDLYAAPSRWQALQNNGMAQNFTWADSALIYQQLYQAALTERNGNTLAITPVN